MDLVSLFTQFTICIGSFMAVNQYSTEFMQESMILCQLYMKCVQKRAAEYIGKRSEPDSPVPVPSLSAGDENAQACHRLANKFVVDSFPLFIKELKK